MAVNVHNVYFRYEKFGRNILNDVNMNIPKCSIYALLGPSACGKTTLFKIILGLLKVNHGIVDVFGNKPGTTESGIPGSGVGYMPQQIALQNDLTINEILVYFAFVYGLPKQFIQNRIDHLLSELELPEKNRFIANLSGGQQRRLSLAISIIHSPRLVILDEPTVGVDPILCNKIWNLLLSMREKTMIIISTHYIEEAKKANVVAFMRKGKILEQDSPKNILNKYMTTSLEKVFLQLAQVDRISKNNTETLHESVMKENIVSCKQANEKMKKPFLSTIMFALMYKCLLETRRNILVTMSLFLLSFITASLLTYCCGNTPHSLNIAFVVNENRQIFNEIRNQNLNETENEELIPFLPDFLSKSLREQNSLIIHNYSSFDLADHDLRKGLIHGLVNIGENFSSCYVESDPYLNVNDEYIDNETIKCGTINLYTDPTNKAISNTIIFSVYLSVIKFQEEISKFFELHENITKPMIRFIHENNIEINTSDFLEGKIFTGPGNIFIAAYYFGTISSVMNTLNEQKSGLLIRNFVAGLTSFHLVSTQLIVKSMFMIISNSINLFASVYLLNIPCYGSVYLIITFLCLTSMVGILQGILVAVLLPNPIFCVFFLTALLYNLNYLGTVFWCLESQPYYIQWLQYVIPMALPVKSLRYLMTKQNASFHPIIWPGFVMNIAWIIILFCACVHCMKMKKLVSKMQ